MHALTGGSCLFLWLSCKLACKRQMCSNAHTRAARSHPVCVDMPSPGTARWAHWNSGSVTVCPASPSARRTVSPAQLFLSFSASGVCRLLFLLSWHSAGAEHTGQPQGCWLLVSMDDIQAFEPRQGAGLLLWLPQSPAFSFVSLINEIQRRKIWRGGAGVFNHCRPRSPAIHHQDLSKQQWACQPFTSSGFGFRWAGKGVSDLSLRLEARTPDLGEQETVVLAFLPATPNSTQLGRMPCAEAHSIHAKIALSICHLHADMFARQDPCSTSRRLCPIQLLPPEY